MERLWHYDNESIVTTNGNDDNDPYIYKADMPGYIMRKTYEYEHEWK